MLRRKLPHISGQALAGLQDHFEGGTGVFELII